MTDCGKVIQGRTGTGLDPFLNLGKGVLGGAAVYALSKAPYAAASIVTATTVATVVCGMDLWDPSGKRLVHEAGFTPFLRGIQLAAANHLYTKFGKWGAMAAMLEPAVHTAFSILWADTWSKSPAITLDVWGIHAPQPKQ